jgi:hypothetical protein
VFIIGGGKQRIHRMVGTLINNTKKERWSPMKKDHFVKGLKRLLVSCEYDESMDFCRKNMRIVIPEKLYKYTPINKHSVENLQNSQLYLNNPRDFNDPFDCLLPKGQAIECLFRENAKKLNIDVTKARDDFYENINQLIDETIRVGCLSEICPTKTIMWSHYGNSHRGMCLEYDFSKCTDSDCNIIRPVMYSNAPIITKSNVIGYENMILLALLSKSNEWKDEKEWRIVVLLPKPSDDGYLLPIPYLKHIYIGKYVEKRSKDEKDEDYRERLELLEKVIKFAHGNNIPISTMDRKDDSYSLESKILV